MNKQDIKYEKWTFLSAIVAGFFAHGYVYVSNFQMHDNVYNFYLGGTISSGRWMLFILNSFMNKLNANYYHYFAPWYIGILSLVFTAVSASFISNMFKVKNKISCIAIGAIMVCFPSMASLYAYMYTAGLYSLGLLMTVVGVWFITTKKKWLLRGLGIILAGCGIGIYQAYVSIFLSLFLMYFIVETYDNKGIKQAKIILTRVCYYFGSTFGIMLFYYMGLKFCLWHYNEELSNYRNVSGGLSSLKGYAAGAGKAYALFFAPFSTGTDNMFYNNLVYFYYLLLASICGSFVFLTVRKIMKNRFQAIMMITASLFLPLALNFVYVITTEDVYSLMMYGECLLFVWGVIVAENVRYELRDMKNNRLKRVAVLLIPVTVLFFSFMYARTTNICYLKAYELQKSAENYYNRLVTRIQTVEGYTEDTPIVIVNYTHAKSKTEFSYHEFDKETKIYPYNLPGLTDDYNWLDHLITSTGFNSNYADASEISDTALVEAMPCYPDDGSIQMIEEKIVIKFHPE